MKNYFFSNLLYYSQFLKIKLEYYNTNILISDIISTILVNNIDKLVFYFDRITTYITLQ